MDLTFGPLSRSEKKLCGLAIGNPAQLSSVPEYLNHETELSEPSDDANVEDPLVRNLVASIRDGYAGCALFILA